MFIENIVMITYKIIKNNSFYPKRNTITIRVGVSEQKKETSVTTPSFS